MLSRSRTLVAALLLSALSSVTGQLQIYQARITHDPLRTEFWRVEGVATVELGGTRPPSYVFDCNTTLNNGSGVGWTRLDGSHLGLTQRELTNGRRLDAGVLAYQNLGNYSCWDERTGERLTLLITDSNPAVVAVNSTVGVTQGNSITLEVYISGYPTVRSIHWYRLSPTRQEVTSGATFLDSGRRMILRNVQTSAAGTYECEATIPLLGSQILRGSARIQLQVYVRPSVRQLQSSNIEVAEWTTPFAINCSATGSPLPTIHWERERGEELSVDTEQPIMTGNNLVTSTLRFIRKGIRYADRGGYRCVASNIHTTPATSDYTYITVTPTLLLDAYINSQTQSDFGELLFAREGSSIRVECFGSGNHYWQTSNGSRISTNSQDTLYQEPDPSRSVQALNIPSFSHDTIDVYTCVTNLTGTLVQRTVFITSSNPAVIISSESRFVLAGNTTTLVATVHAHPSANTAGWYLNGNQINAGDHGGTIYSFTVDSTMYTLRIQNIQESRLGLYKFVATVGNQTASDSITLSFPDPPSSSTTPSTVTANIGDSVQFHCEAGGSGSLNVEWRRADGLTLPADVVQSGNNLIIAQVQSSDAGTYICSVENLAGRAENTTVLNVFNRPTATITYQQLSITSSTRRLNLTHGDEGPTFSCTGSGYFPPTLTWRKDNGALPNQVNSVMNNEGVQPIRELRWSRSLSYTDSGSYLCRAENDNGTDNATLDLLVRYHPEINTITPTNPVQSDPSASTPTFAIPASYIGKVLTCSAFAWPAPTVQWLRNDHPLPSEVSSEQLSRGLGIVSAILTWTRPFVSSDMGTYKCLVRWDNTTIQSKVQVIQGSITTEPPPSCSVDTTSIFFQVRVLAAGCDQWDAALKEHIGNQFQQELFRIVETECNCTLQPNSIQINNPPQCSEDDSSGVVFRGTMRAQTVASTTAIFCSILDWQQGGSLINLNENLYRVDSQCILQVDSFTSQECAVTPTSQDPGTNTVILIAAPVGGVLLAAIVVMVIVLCCIHYCCIKKRMKALSEDVGQQQPKDAPTLQRVAFYGGAAVSPSPSPVHHTQQMQLSEGGYFDEPTYSDPIPRSQRTHSVDPSPEHIPLRPMRTLSRDRLISYSSGSLNNMVASQHSETNAQPYSQPVSSTGSMTTVGRTHPPRVDTSRVVNHPIGAINPLSLTTGDSPGRRSSEGVVPSYHGNSHHGYNRRASEGVSQAAHYLPAVDESGTKEADDQWYSRNTHSATPASSIVKLAPISSLSRDSASEELPPYSSRPPSLMGTSTGSRPTSAGSESITRGSRPTSAGSIAKRGQLTSTGSESITYGGRPPSTCSSSIANGGQPWYIQSESDISLNQHTRRPNTSAHSGSRGRLPSDIQPYAQIHNSAIPPFTNQKPIANGSPRAQAGPYAEPIMRNSTTSIDTFTRVQNSPHLEMVTV